MRAVLAVTVLMACACVAWAGEPAAPGPAAITAGMRDFERNVALGAILETRAGTSAELGELRLLADRGLKAAQDLAAKNPESADAQYLLGSWLLYGYRVVTVDQIAFDATRGARTETVNRIIQGLSDDPQPGLDALKRSTELAPNNGDHLLDYGAALLDWDRMFEAAGILKGIWAGQPPLSQAQKMRAGILLSGVSEAQGDLAAAREWIYSALSLDPEAAEAVEHLRHLDAAQAAEAWNDLYEADVEQTEEEAVEEGYEEEYLEESGDEVSGAEAEGETGYDELYDSETEGEGWSEEEAYSEENEETQ
jgi:hypothetical protein